MARGGGVPAFYFNFHLGAQPLALRMERVVFVEAFAMWIVECAASECIFPTNLGDFNSIFILTFE